MAGAPSPQLCLPLSLFLSLPLPPSLDLFLSSPPPFSLSLPPALSFSFSRARDRAPAAPPHRWQLEAGASGVRPRAGGASGARPRIGGASGAKSTPQWKFDDLKSWIWLQKAIHPELDYDLCLRKKWFSRKITHWNGISIRKWVKEMKQNRKEAERLRRAEVHAAVSVAGNAAALAAIAAENAEPGQPSSLKETAVASAAALVAAQCTHVAEATGAKREQLNSAVNAAMTATDANNIITLTAAAATSLRGAAILRGRRGHREKIRESSPTLLYDEFDFDFGRCRAALAKGDEIHVTTPDGKCRLRFVSIVLNGDGKIILKIKKISMLTAFSAAEEILRQTKQPLSDLLLFRSASDGRITENRTKDPIFKHLPMSLLTSSTISPSPSPSKVSRASHSISKSKNDDDRATNMGKDEKMKQKKRASSAAPVHLFSCFRFNPVVNRFARGFSRSGIKLISC